MAAKKQTSAQPNSVDVKGLRYKLQLFDGFWSIPLAILLFVTLTIISKFKNI